MVALAFLLLMIVLAVFAPLVAPHDPDETSARAFETPSLDHLLGTDHLGRDTFSRIIYGAQVSLRSGFQIVGIAPVVRGARSACSPDSVAAAPTSPSCG